MRRLAPTCRHCGSGCSRTDATTLRAPQRALPVGDDDDDDDGGGGEVEVEGCGPPVVAVPVPCPPDGGKGWPGGGAEPQPAASTSTAHDQTTSARIRTPPVGWETGGTPPHVDVPSGESGSGEFCHSTTRGRNGSTRFQQD